MASETPDDPTLVPYAPDFTPATLGKSLGEDEVLAWLLSQASDTLTRSEFLERVANQCLSHVKERNHRRDMASHVLQGMKNYGLVVLEGEKLQLTPAGDAIARAPAAERDQTFARHIITKCNGYRLVEAIQNFELRGEQPSLEQLTETLDRSPTSKNISSMKAWLVRAGVLRDERGYAVDESALAEVMGSGPANLLGLSGPELEFLLAARVLQLQTGHEELDAPAVKRLAEMRAPGVRIPGKALGNFVRGLVARDLLQQGEQARGRGGTRSTFKLSDKGFSLSDDEIRSLLGQSSAGVLISQLRPLEEVLAGLEAENANEAGTLGELLAIHVCLMLNLHVLGWRTRLPIEIDLIADRLAALSYQRWHVQVKNTTGDLDSDRVDREIGAAHGTGATHILFVVPRASVTRPARAEIDAKNRISNLHIFVLTIDNLGGSPFSLQRITDALELQLDRISRAKRDEATRREDT